MWLEADQEGIVIRDTISNSSKGNLTDLTMSKPAHII